MAPLLLLLAVAPLAVKLTTLAIGAEGYLSQSAYKVVQLAIPIAWRYWALRKRGLACLWPVDEPLPSRSTWLLAVGIAAALAGTAIIVVPVLAQWLDLSLQVARSGFDERFAMTPLRAAAVVLYLLSINAAIEELHFRAWLDRELAARWGTLSGVVGSATMFGLMHTLIFAGMKGIGPAALTLVFVALVIASVLWSLLMRRPGGIHAAWLSHGLTDAALLTWGLFWLGYF